MKARDAGEANGHHGCGAVFRDPAHRGGAPAETERVESDERRDDDAAPRCHGAAGLAGGAPR
jgi:hypothetical protein